MTQFPSGVAIVTTTDAGGQPRGMTCSSLCSVTAAPPTLLVCLRSGSPTLEAVQRKATFAVNLLHEHARPVAELFASGAADRFDRISWDADPDSGGPHLTGHANAIADCRVSLAQPVGGHVVVFGEIFRVSNLWKTAPLLYGLRQYTSWPTTRQPVNTT